MSVRSSSPANVNEMTETEILVRFLVQSRLKIAFGVSVDNTSLVDSQNARTIKIDSFSSSKFDQTERDKGLSVSSLAEERIISIIIFMYRMFVAS